MTQNFPKYISNKPCGEDKFDGKSQERLVNAISNHIISKDSESTDNCKLPRIIGLDGAWGSGKSNVVKLLKEHDDMNGSYHFFCYDAWGSQEDLQRRSILELLTKDLIANKILSGKTKHTVNGRTMSVAWDEKLKYLLSRKSEKISEKIPRINGGTAVAILVAILTPITALIGSVLESDTDTDKDWIVPLVVAIAPIVFGLLIWGGFAIFDKKYRSASALLAVYKDEVKSFVNYEVLSVDEPTVSEFKQWMESISVHIGNNNKPRLVIVFDNMDRLPAEKVKQLWSSIHTFFSEEGFDNIWTIIPYDEQHLSCAFQGDNKDESKKLTKYFIDKTFPIVFRVSPPVITDYKGIINDYMKEAFGDITNEEFVSINRIYRMARATPNVREVIVFINELVSLYNTWYSVGEVSLRTMAVYTLLRDEIQNKKDVKVENQILSGDYLGTLNHMVLNTEQLQSEIAALVYGVEISKASQIPLKRYLEDCIQEKSDTDINKYSEVSSQFDTILEEVVYDADFSNLDVTIKSLNKLKKSSPVVSLLWKDLANKLRGRELVKQEFSETYKLVVLNNPDNIQKLILDDFVQKVQYCKDFKGENYFTSLNLLECFIEDNNLDYTMSLDKIETYVINNFVEYIHAAKNEYKKYKLSIEPSLLDVSFVTFCTTGDFYPLVVHYLDKEEYGFPLLKDELKEFVVSDKLTTDNFADVYSIYRAISSKDAIEKVPQTKVTSFLNHFRPTSDDDIRDGYYDIAAMAIAYKHNEAVIGDKTTARIADVVQSYCSYESLLLQSVTHQHQLCKKVAEYLMTNDKGYKMRIENIIPKFYQIVSALGVTEKMFYKDLNGWSEYAVGTIHKDNIQNIVPDVRLWTVVLENKDIDLSKHLCDVALSYIEDITVNFLYDNKGSNQYWITVIMQFLDNNVMLGLTSNLIELGKRLLENFSNGTSLFPMNAFVSKVFEKLENSTLVNVLMDIANKICNKEIRINTELFILLEHRLRTTSVFGDRPDAAVNYYIRPVLDHKDCLDLILENKEYYAEIINHSGDTGQEVKNKFEIMLATNSSEEFVIFAGMVGIKATVE